MRTAIVNAACIVGVDAKLIEVEVHLHVGLPKFEIVGSPDSSIKESRARVSSALKHIWGKFPVANITINLAPAELHKYGSGFDLPIALGILAAIGELPADSLKNKFFIGELSLEGVIRPINGILAIAHQLSLQRSNASLVVCSENANEAALVEEITIFSAENLATLVKTLKNNLPLTRVSTKSWTTHFIKTNLDISDVKAQEKGKRALEIAAAGGHHLLFLGPPGSGKTMLAKRLSSILPPLSNNQALEVAKIHSVAGLTDEYSSNLGVRPFREPHHNISTAGMIGGGSLPRPGEISLAHNGILFMDELPEFSKAILDALRQPLENFFVIISRAKLSLRFPCKFQLVAAMNPCPCGYYGDKNHTCSCSLSNIFRYRNRISGPILDRIDMQVELPNLSYRQLQSSSTQSTSPIIQQKVISALKCQQKRYNHSDRLNSDISHAEIGKFIPLDRDSKEFLGKAMDKFKFSNRAHDRILKIARTIADLGKKKDVELSDLAEALNYRLFDRQKVYD